MRAAGALLVIAGLLIVLGAPTTWVTCPQIPCEVGEGQVGLTSLLPRSGFDVRWGIATALLGIVVLAAGILGSRRAGLLDFAPLAGVMTLLIAVGFALRVWVVPEYDSYGPGIGFIATALGGLIAAVGDPVLRRRSPRR